MKKIALLLSMTVLSSAMCYTQNKIKKNQVSKSLGMSIPLGNFGSKNSSNEKAGFADVGFNNNIYFRHIFPKNIGLNFKFFDNKHRLDTSILIQDKNKQTGMDWQLKKTGWLSGGAMLGISYNIIKKENYIFEFSCMYGLLTLKSPEIKFSLVTDNQVWVTVQSSTTSAMGYDLGAGVSYFLSQRWTFNFNIDYIASNFNFAKIKTTTSTGTNSENSSEQPFRIINLTVGIGFNFGKI